MLTANISFAGMELAIRFPQSFSQQIKILFPDSKIGNQDQSDISFSIIENDTGALQLLQADQLLQENLSAEDAAVVLMNEVIRAVAENVSQHIAIHAAAVSKNGISLVVPANTGGGKTSLSAWLVSKGFEYLTDELILFAVGEVDFCAFYRPLNIKLSGLEVVKPLTENFSSEQEIKAGNVIIWPPEFIGNRSSQLNKRSADLLIFPNYQKDSKLIVEPLSPAQTGLELMACNVNARNLEDHGFKQLSDIARLVPGIRLTYSHFWQLEPLLLELIDLMATKMVNSNFLRKLFEVVPLNKEPDEKIKTEYQAKIPAATIKAEKKKLCIGMATYDDYDGVYFSAQAIRLYHPEVTEDTEILVLDNHPTGKCSQDLKALDNKIKHYRYQPITNKTSTAIRDQIFEYTDADYVLCMDCHVFLEPGAINKLLDYFMLNADSNDLLQGPMYSDDLKQLSTHFNPIWNQGMYGVWGRDKRAENPQGPAFDIPMQGLGLFACRKDAWPGFNKNFVGLVARRAIYMRNFVRLAVEHFVCLFCAGCIDLPGQWVFRIQLTA